MNEQLNVSGTCRLLLFICVIVITFNFTGLLISQSQSSRITTKDQKAEETINVAIKALGGVDIIDDIKSLVIIGSGTNALFESGLANGFQKVGSLTYDFEIRILLPDNFIQINRFPGYTRYSGISGKTLIPPLYFPTLPPELEYIELVKGTPADITANETKERIVDWSRFLVGILAKAGSDPLTLSSSNTSGFTLTNTNGTMSEIEFDSKNGYPTVVKYKIPGHETYTRDPISGVPILQSNMIDAEVRFWDRFSVNGVMFPRKITRTAPSMMDRVMLIEDVQINPKLSLKDFEVPEQ